MSTPNEGGRAKRKGHGLRGPRIDTLYEQTSAAVTHGKTAQQIWHTNADKANVALMYLLNHAESGGEVATLLGEHLGDVAHEASEDQQLGELLGHVREFYAGLNPSQRRLMCGLFAGITETGCGIKLGTSREGKWVTAADSLQHQGQRAS